MNTRPVTFPRWKDALARATLSPQVKAAHTREILTFLHHCKTAHAPATVELIKQYLLIREPRTAAQPVGEVSGPAHEALRWFFREGRRAGESALGTFCGPAKRSTAPSRPQAERQTTRAMEPPQIYLHVMKKLGLGVRSPLDQT